MRAKDQPKCTTTHLLPSSLHALSRHLHPRNISQIHLRFSPQTGNWITRIQTLGDPCPFKFHRAPPCHICRSNIVFFYRTASMQTGRQRVSGRGAWPETRRVQMLKAPMVCHVLHSRYRAAKLIRSSDRLVKTLCLEAYFSLLRPACPQAYIYRAVSS